MGYLYSSTIYSKSSTKSIPWRKINENGYHQSHSLNIKINDASYVSITTNHSIPPNSKKIFSLTSQSEKPVLNKLILAKRSMISDLCLLEFGTIRKDFKLVKTNDIKDLNFLSMNKFYKKIPKEMSEFTIYLDYNNEIKMNFGRMVYQEINGCKDLPLTPFLSCKFFREYPEVNLNGLSGSPVYFKNKVIGIISNYNIKENTINLVPS